MLCDKPILNLSLGRNLEHDDLREGTDLFFECRIDANPHPYKVEWSHDGDLVTHNVTAGVLVSESTLALQKVRRERSGLYQCRASNVEGDTTSEPLNITIKYAPRCSVSPSLRGVGLLEPLNVSCQVDANPPDVTFSWTFNNSVRREQSEQVNSKRYKTEGLQSVLFYTPMSERDYGTLLCYASNTVGVQKTPCSFTVISAGAPEEVTGCSIDNITSHSSTVLCTPGFNGGLPQLFLLQVWKENTPRADELVVNITLTQPEFLVRLLEPGHHYRAEVIAHNARGAAPPVTLYIHTLKQAEMHISLPSRSEPSPLMLVLAVIGGALLVVVLLLVGVWAVRGRRRNSHAHGDNAHIPMKESNPDILEAAPQPQSSAHTISISIIKQPPRSYDGEPSPPPLNVAAEDLGMGMGLRTGLSSQKTTFGLSEPLHRPIEKSLQNPVRLPYDDDPPSSPEVSERTQLTPSTIDPCVTLGVEAAVRASRRLPYSRTPVYRDGGSPSCARQPLMLGSSESVM
nr:nephrin-like [Procambarus clarkii]